MVQGLVPDLTKRLIYGTYDRTHRSRLGYEYTTTTHKWLLTLAVPVAGDTVSALLCRTLAQRPEVVTIDTEIGPVVFDSVESVPVAVPPLLLLPVLRFPGGHGLRNTCPLIIDSVLTVTQADGAVLTFEFCAAVRQHGADPVAGHFTDLVADGSDFCVIDDGAVRRLRAPVADAEVVLLAYLCPC